VAVDVLDECVHLPTTRRLRCVPDIWLFALQSFGLAV
jgi:hypothetical protein